MAARRARVKVKTRPLTRAQASAEFGRKKARQKRRESHRKVLMIAGSILGTMLVAFSWWSVHTGRFAESVEALENHALQLSTKAGFRLDQVTLIGRSHADAKAVKAALAIEQGAPILGVSLSAMKQRLEAVPEVKTAVISRTLPDNLRITITERIPAALWQNEGNLQLIDREGIVLARERYKEDMTLPVVVGPDAPKHMAELIALMDSVPSLRPDVVAAVRVGGRRWNIQLSRNIVVMLPEDAPDTAWKRFAELVETKALLSKAIRSVDMRMEDRVFITPVEEKKNPITLTSARDT
jgi:cell division protein FtsQ